MSFTLQSSAFEPGATIPAHYTCQGDDVSPPLNWSGGPENVAVFTLVMDDPDAPTGTFTHWLLCNLPGDVRDLTEAMPTAVQLANGVTQGRNDFGKIGYGGPCPPPGPPHRYRFTLYALDARPLVRSGATKQQVLDGMKEHILDQAQLIGMYQRKAR